MRAVLALTLTLAGWATTSLACQNVGELCKPGVDCCQPPLVPQALVCMPRVGQGSICVEGAPVPTTTMVSGPSPTTTTRPAPLPPPPVVSQVRFPPCALGLAYSSPDDRKVDPRTGGPGNDYLACVMVEQAIWELMPEVMRVIQDLPSCASIRSSVAANASDNIPSRLWIQYSVRTIDGGAPYPCILANYNWEYTRLLFRQLRDCAPPNVLSSRLQQALNLPGMCPAPLPRKPGTYSNAGLIGASHAGPPLTPAQCGLLEAAHAAHEAHVKALLAHDLAAASSAAEHVRPTQRAFEESARDVNQLALFTLIFTGAIDPAWSEAERDAFTRETSEAHHEWVVAFKCETKKPPDVKAVWRARQKHGRAHFLRAIKMDGITITEVCPGAIDRCPHTAN